MNWKTGLLAAAFGAALVLGGASAAEARNDRNCRERVSREETKLRREINRHGWNSRQARNQRVKLDRLRRECRFAFNNRDRDRDRRVGRRDRDRGGIRGVLRDRGVIRDRDRDRDRRWRRDRRDRDRDRDRDRRWGRDGRFGRGRGAQFGDGVIFLPNGGTVVLPPAARNAPVFRGGPF